MNSLTFILVSLLVVQMFFLIVNMLSQATIKRLAKSTHIIVNSQRTMMLRLISQLTRRIANENPTDQKAQDAAATADKDAFMSDKPRRN